MKNVIKHTCAVLLCIVWPLFTPVAQAAVLTYDFVVTVDFGPLSGNTYTGQTSFNISPLTKTGLEELSLQSFSFDFNATHFGLADATNTPVAQYQDGVFLGIAFENSAYDPSFTLFAGLVDTSDAGFGYTKAPGIEGSGTLTYTQAPVPVAAWLLVVGLPGLWMARKRA